MVAYGVHIAIQGVEEHVRCAQALEGLYVSVDLVQRALASNPLRFAERRSVRRRRMRGPSAGSGWPYKVPESAPGHPA